jgi:hypothetical protein
VVERGGVRFTPTLQPENSLPNEETRSLPTT